MKILRSFTRLALAVPLVLALSCGDDDNPTPPMDTTPPAKITDLRVVTATGLGITLAWTAPGDDGNSGQAVEYQLRTSDSPVTDANWSAATEIPVSPAPSPAGTAELFTFSGLDTMLVHHFGVRTRDDGNNWSAVSNDAVWMPRGGSVSYVKNIPPYLDNTMYQESDTLSNALGEHVYAGMNNQGASAPIDARRGLMAFAIADSIPAGAVIDSVALVLNLTKKAPFTSGNVAVTLHVLTASWGEGTSVANLGPGEGGGGSATPGDATWLDRFRGTSLWTTPGGDFNPVASASTLTNLLGKYTWTSPVMRDDVQSWLDTPSGNFGWILIGDETATAGNVRQFDSRQNSTANNRPRLTVFYTVTP